MGKPFLTIQQQIELLESRGVKTDDASGSILLREGYYSVVNGYKDPFIDREATAAAGDDRYREGTTLTDIYDLFSFDRKLRGLTFHYLIKAEAAVRTAISYCFSDAHREEDAYLFQANYCSKEEFAASGNDSNRYASEITGLIGILSSRANRSGASFITHYRESYGAVPLWVLTNDLTFGNLEHFFNLMKPAEQRDFCKTIVRSTGRLGDGKLGYFDVQRARVSLEVLVKFRNICAHDERLYCARVGGRKAVNYAKMVWMLERYLTKSEFLDFLTDFVSMIESSLAKDRAFAHVLIQAGFPEIASEIKHRLNEQ